MYNECALDRSGKSWCPYKLKGDMTYDDSGVNKWDTAPLRVHGVNDIQI